MVKLLKAAFDYLRATQEHRFYSRLVVAGSALLGFSWVDFASQLLTIIPGFDGGPASIVVLVVGILLIVVGIFGFLTIDVRKRRKLEVECGAKLLRNLRNLQQLFRQAGTIKDAGFAGVELVGTVEAAKDFLNVPPRRLKGSRVISAITHGSFDASKAVPFYGVSAEEMDDLIDLLRSAYEA